MDPSPWVKRSLLVLVLGPAIRRLLCAPGAGLRHALPAAATSRLQRPAPRTSAAAVRRGATAATAGPAARLPAAGLPAAGLRRGAATAAARAPRADGTVRLPDGAAARSDPRIPAAGPRLWLLLGQRLLGLERLRLGLERRLLGSPAPRLHLYRPALRLGGRPAGLLPQLLAGTERLPRVWICGQPGADDLASAPFVRAAHLARRARPQHDVADRTGRARGRLAQ